MASWDVVLRDRVGGFLAPVHVPFKVRRGLNESAHVSFTLDHEDEAAALMITELTLGIPQVALYRDGVLWARGWWHPMEESAGQDGTSMGCVFRGPFAEVEGTRFTTAYKMIAPYNGAPIVPLTRDQGDHLLYAADVRFSSRGGLRAGTNVPSVTRDRAYPVDKNRAEAVMQLTEVINGAEFLEQPVEYLTYEPGGGTRVVLAEFDVGGTGRFGSDKSASVIFEHGFGASNVTQVNRQIGRPVNHVAAKGAEWVVEAGTFKGTYRYVSSAYDTASQDRYGVLSELLDLPDITSAAILQEHAAGALRPSPPQAVAFQPDASGDLQPWTSYWLGDTVRLVAARDALQVDMTSRVRAIEIDVDADGNETHTLEIGDQRVRPLMDTLRGLARVARALARHEASEGS